MAIQHENFHLLYKLLDGLEPLENCILRSEGFMDLCVVVQDKNIEYIIVKMAHFYFNHNQMLPDPIMTLSITPADLSVQALDYTDANGMHQKTYPDKNDELYLDQKVEESLNTFLKLWLSNLLNQGHKKADYSWKLKPQERNDQRYMFAGKMHVTQGVQEKLSPGDLGLIIISLQTFLASKNGFIDYLQVFEHSQTGEKIYAIDQLDEAMLNGSDYSEEEKKQYNYFTILFAHEY